jgi:hypothetical protein
MALQFTAGLAVILDLIGETSLREYGERSLNRVERLANSPFNVTSELRGRHHAEDTHPSDQLESRAEYLKTALEMLAFIAGTLAVGWLL